MTYESDLFEPWLLLGIHPQYIFMHVQVPTSRALALGTCDKVHEQFQVLLLALKLNSVQLLRDRL